MIDKKWRDQCFNSLFASEANQSRVLIVIRFVGFFQLFCGFLDCFGRSSLAMTIHIQTQKAVQTFLFKPRTETMRTALHTEHRLKINRQKPFCILIFDDFFNSVIFDARSFSSAIDSQKLIISLNNHIQKPFWLIRSFFLTIHAVFLTELFQNRLSKVAFSPWQNRLQKRTLRINDFIVFHLQNLTKPQTMRTSSFLSIRRKMLSRKFRIGDITVWTIHFISKPLNYWLYLAFAHRSGGVSFFLFFRRNFNIRSKVRRNLLFGSLIF